MGNLIAIGRADLQLDNIPDELKVQRSWVIWRAEARETAKGTKVSKAPLSASTGGPCKWSEPSNLATFADAVRGLDKHQADGIGFVFKADHPVVGVDIDDCIDEEGNLHPAAGEVARALPGYWEVSPSGRGIKGFVRAEGVERRGTRLPDFPAPGIGIEIYTDLRHFTVTGHRHELSTSGATLPETGKEFAALIERIEQAKAERNPAPTRTQERVSPSVIDLSDRELLDIARRAKNGPAFAALYDLGDWKGQGFPSQSEADLSLCTKLSFYLGADPGRVDAAFRGSALMRDKWDRSVGRGETHGQRTVAMAVAGTSETYSPPRQKVNQDVDLLELGRADQSVDDDLPLDKKSERAQRMFEKLLEVCEAQFPFFSCDDVPYLSPGDSLAIPLESSKAEQYIRHAFYRATGVPASSDLIGKFISIKSAELAIEKVTRPVFRRVGRVGEVHYLDLCQGGKVVEMTAQGWRILTNPAEVYFVRTGAEDDALPTPEPGGDVLALSRVINVGESMLRLLLVWLVAALRVGYPYVVMVLEGEAGSGKSTLAKVLKYLIDPSKELLRTFPACERDFSVYAHNSHALTLDNVDRITTGQSDMLCRAATGGGFSARNHYSMTDETVISIQRPVIITGIQGLVERADMADRVALIQLERVDEKDRMTEESLWSEVEEIRPQVLGGLLDAFVAALANLGKVKLSRLPRMADFAKFATAAETGLPWEAGAALAAYHETRESLFEQALEKDRVAVAVLNFLEKRDLYTQESWEGSAANLLSELTPPYGGEDRWPTKPATLMTRLAKAMPLLRQRGVSFGKRKSNGSKLICLSFAKRSTLSTLSTLSGINTGENQGRLEGRLENQGRPSPDPARETGSTSGSTGSTTGSTSESGRPCKNGVVTGIRVDRVDRVDLPGKVLSNSPPPVDQDGRDLGDLLGDLL